MPAPKRKPITLGDLAANPAIRRLNPHLFECTNHSTEIALPKEPTKKKKFRESPKPKTKPEKQMDLMLRVQRERGEFVSYGFEELTLEIGDGVTYKPDFVIWKHDGTLRFVEVKGPFIRPDSVIKWKTAKGRYRLAEWELWQLSKDGWTRLA